LQSRFQVFVFLGAYAVWPLKDGLSCIERKHRLFRPGLHKSLLAPGFSKKLENLAACTALCLAYCNFCRMHGSLPGTPAMAARTAGHPWTLEELYDAV
jgi:hypothetical protein